MCLLYVQSSNPHFSWIIVKNPESGMSAKSMRKGVAYGFYPIDKNTQKIDTSRYVVYFLDGANDISYKEYPEQEFEYLNKLRYMSPIFVLNTISEFFSTAYKKENKLDTSGFFNRMFINSVDMNDSAHKSCLNLLKYFPNYEITFNEITFNGYEIIIETQESMYKLLNFCNVLFTMISSITENDFYLSDDQAIKIISSLNVINAPYYPRSIINNRVVNRPNLYKLCKNLLLTPDINIKFGNSAINRRDFISKELSFSLPIVDIGCGTGFYAISFSKRLKNIEYFAMDIDENELKCLQTKIDRNEIRNIEIFNNLNNLIKRTKEPEIEVEIILTEVIEHMELTQVEIFIKDILNGFKFTKLIITTPNKDFNSNYIMDTEFRHDDHKWEMNTEEFHQFMDQILSSLDKNYSVEFYGIGDEVRDTNSGKMISCSQGCIIKKN